MQLFASKNLSSLSGYKYIFLDNDFLNCLFKNNDFFQIFLSQSKLGNFLYDPLIGFEFLRDIFVPKERVPREKFLGLDIFIQAEIQSVFMKLYENALLLSKILAMNKKNSGNNKKPHSSLTDLYLMGRLMLNDPKNHLLITGNKKDFPSYLFNTKEIIIAFDEERDFLLSFYILQFNRNKFDKEYEKLTHINLI